MSHFENSSNKICLLKNLEFAVSFFTDIICVTCCFIFLFISLGICFWSTKKNEVEKNEDEKNKKMIENDGKIKWTTDSIQLK